MLLATFTKLTDSKVQLLTNYNLSYHDILALQDHERGKVDIVTYTINADNHPPTTKLYSICSI